jgi:hypothetical protein
MKNQIHGQAQKLQPRAEKSWGKPTSQPWQKTEPWKRTGTPDGATFYSCLPAVNSGCCQISRNTETSKGCPQQAPCLTWIFIRTAKGLQLAVWDCSINSTLFPIGSMASLNTKCFSNTTQSSLGHKLCSGSRSPPQVPTHGLITDYSVAHE